MAEPGRLNRKRSVLPSMVATRVRMAQGVMRSLVDAGLLHAAPDCLRNRMRPEIGIVLLRENETVILICIAVLNLVFVLLFLLEFHGCNCGLTDLKLPKASAL